MACPQYLVLVCHNVRPPTDDRGCCKAKGAEAILGRFKAIRAERRLSTLYRATSSGCLGACEAGPTVGVVRNTGEGAAPAATYYSGIRPEQVEEIVQEHLVDGRPIERLRTREEWID